MLGTGGRGRSGEFLPGEVLLWEVRWRPGDYDHRRSGEVPDRCPAANEGQLPAREYVHNQKAVAISDKQPAGILKSENLGWPKNAPLPAEAARESDKRCELTSISGQSLDNLWTIFGQSLDNLW